MSDHWHCPSPGCYWRIQFVPTCSRCDGACVPGGDDCGCNGTPRKRTDEQGSKR